ncbi:metallophosphoesterase [Cohnella nanjingensis]|uniref:Metallophosphoesterase n=1 Tax=Cohnella nanjingensis TaxID=1387779 RepID=A0A7X0RVD5_9BACL|nr:metallophosphoesterase [Cohnella nanjingensis]MBB6674382.1 metallophosphoesterase [Cohnella nanjingensis]
MSRLFAISDIHGHVEGARLLLARARYVPGTDTLVLLGDFIDRDPASWGALTFIRSLTDQGAIAIAGNMERYMLEHAQKDQALSSTYEEELRFLSKLPLYFRQDPYLFVHAGIRPGIRLEQQSAADLTGIRQDFWSSDVPLPCTVVFGHTPSQRIGAKPGELWQGADRLGIDTGAKHGLRLTLVELTGHLAYSCATDPSDLYGDLRTDRYA